MPSKFDEIKKILHFLKNVSFFFKFTQIKLMPRKAKMQLSGSFKRSLHRIPHQISKALLTQNLIDSLSLVSFVKTNALPTWAYQF